MAMLAYEEAVRYYEVALQRVEHRDPVDRGCRCQLLIALREAYTKAGEVSQAIETLRQAAESARQLRGYPETRMPCRSAIKQHSCGNETQDDHKEQAYLA